MGPDPAGLISLVRQARSGLVRQAPSGLVRQAPPGLVRQARSGRPEVVRAGASRRRRLLFAEDPGLLGGELSISQDTLAVQLAQVGQLANALSVR